MFSSTADTVGTGIMSSIRAISAAASGGIDSATVSAIASSYAQSAASGKLDSSAFNSADFYSTSNPSGFITGVDLTPYQPTSAMSAYATTAYVESGLSGKENVFSAGTGLEFVQSGSDRVLQVEAPVDIVAGPGIVIDNPDGNTLRVSQQYPTDETVLWTGTIGAPGSTGVLSEAITNFEFVEVYAKPVYGGMCPVVTRFATISSKNSVRFGTFSQDGGSTFLANYTVDFSGTSVSVARSKRISINHSSGSISVTDIDTTGSYKAPITKIVGIHRIAGGN